MRSKLTTIILIGMVLGILVGYACHILWPDPKTAKSIADYISLFTDIFLRLIKMIIAPLVFSTLVVGVAHMGDTKAVGRIGAKAMTWFIGASLISLLVGMVLVNVLRPGDNLNLPLPDADAATNLKVTSLSMKEFVAHLVPRSVVEAMATNEILQIVVFSLFFGVACAALGERARKLVEGIEQLSHVILSITGYVMALAPIAVFASMAAIVTTQGLGILVTYGKFVLEFYFGLAVLWCILIGVGFLIFGRHNLRLIDLIREPDVSHPRVSRALSYRDDVQAWRTPDSSGVVLLGRGVAGRRETAIEVDENRRSRGLGRALAAAARHLAEPGEPLWAQVAPANAASVRAFLAAGFTPVGAEILLARRTPERPE